MHLALRHGNPAWLQLDPPMMAAIAVWCLFSIYWEYEAKNSAPATASESRVSRWFHLLLINAAQLLLFVEVYGLERRYLPVAAILAGIGLAVEFAGVALAVWARRCLGRNWSGKIAINAGHKLVRSGPYRALRHPIYTALLGMYAGTALVSGQYHALLGLALAVIAYLRKVRLEEANLVRGFGAEYEAYRAESWALIPGVF